MADTKKRRQGAGFVALAALGLLVPMLTGCAYSLSEFALERPAPPATNLASAPEASGAAIPLEPTALAEPESPSGRLPPAATATALVASPASYPTPGPPPAEPDSKLLTPEEKARVIAELEALAKSQKVSPPPAPGQVKKCEDEALAPAERLRREAEGIQC